jgi:hypothetical protein
MKPKQAYSFTIITILKEFQSNLNLEKGFLKTIIDLIIRPNKVITSYIENERGLYFSPARLLITIISIFAIYSSIFGSSYTNDVVLSNMDHYSALYKTIFNYLNESPVLYIFFAIIPASILARLLFWTSNRNIAMHLVVNIYIMTQILFFGIAVQELLVLFNFTDVTINFLGVLISILFLIYYNFSYIRFLKITTIISFLKVMLLNILLLLMFVLNATPFFSIGSAKTHIDWSKILLDFGIPVVVIFVIILINKLRKFINNRLK